ncbi:glycosyltransferase [Candidatus Saccharibacteria bacterium]|nr:glycosyltransferase [Candidatus Saccharibacteria bacterium]
MIKRAIRRSLDKVGLHGKAKALKYKRLTEFLGLKDGFVYHTHQIKFSDGKLFATGDDPQILIELKNKTSSMEIEFNIDHGGDDVELFCSKDGAVFDEKNKIVVGKADGEDNSEIAPFNVSTKYFRLDLAKTPGEICIKKFDLVPDDFCGDRLDLKLERIPVASGNGYVVVTHAMDGTGAPLLAYNISKRLKERGEDVVVLALSGGFLIKKYKEQQIPVISLFQDLNIGRIENKEDLSRIAQKLREKEYSNLLTNTVISGLVTPYFKECGYKIVSLIHEMKNSIVNYKMEDGGRNANFYADWLIFPDKIVEREFQDVFDSAGSRVVVLPQGLYKKYEKNIPNKVAVCKKYNIPENAKIIFGSGSADLRKGIDLFFHAAADLVGREEKGQECHFIWTGDYVDDNLENWLNYQADKMGIKSRMHVAKFVKDLKVYQNMVECADAFWLTSREDPFPSVMVEALRYGTPVVAFEGCGGADTMLADGRGILIENFDTQKMAIETKKLIDDSCRMDKMIEKARDYIEKNLNFDKYADRIMGYFATTIHQEQIDLTVVIPNYNYEKYLPMRIASILSQTVLPKEIILLDDNSTDDSVKIAEPILDAANKKYGIKYKIIKNSDNRGCFRQWVKGFEEASYDFVWVAEADDYAAPTFVATVMDGFKDKGVVLSYCKSVVIDSDSVVADYDYNSYLEDLDARKWEKDFILNGKKFVTNYLSQKNVIPNASSVIFRKSAVKNIGEYLDEYQAIGDWLAYIYVIGQGEVSYCAKTLNGHRRHGKSIIANQEKSACFAKEMMMIKTYLLENFEFDDKKLNELMLSTLNENFDISLVNHNEGLKAEYNDLVNLYCEKRKRDNLLIVLPDFEVGGGQAVGIRFANYFKKYYNVFILNTREKLETKYMREMIDGDIVVLKHGDKMDRIKFFQTTFKFKAVISLIWWSDKLSYQAFTGADTKRIISMHGCYENILEHPEIDTFFDDNVEKMLSSAAYVVYTAEKNKKVFKEKNIDLGDKLVKIDNGFLLGDYPKKTKKELGIDDKDFVFGLVARGIPEKGYEQAITGLEYVNSVLKNKAHLVLVGAGDYIDELKEKYVSKYIHFVDNTSEPLEWIGWEETFDVGLLPSYFKSESMPTAVIEMLFLGKPIIATNIGEIKSMLIGDGVEAGVVISLVDGKPNQKELNSTMLDFAKNPKRLKKYQQGAKKMAGRFDMEKCIREYRKLIEK